MTSRSARPNFPDLFSAQSAQEPVCASSSVVRHVLPNDLPNALKQLSDDELERLLAAALAEQKRRGKKPGRPAPGNRQADLVGLALTPSKINAVRAAFKAGIKPAQIARQFGISRTDVQKVLAAGRV